MSIENVVNQALDQIGYPRHIGSIFDGTPAARVALDLWGQTRDSLLYTLQPEWAKKDEKLILSKEAPNIQGGTAQYDLTPWSSIYPPLPWLYEYTAPTDCIKPLHIKTTPLFLPVWQPRAYIFRHISTSTTETILTNAPDAILTYIHRLLDPDDWEFDFKDAMIQLLARKMQAEFAKGTQPKEAKDADAAD